MPPTWLTCFYLVCATKSSCIIYSSIVNFHSSCGFWLIFQPSLPALSGVLDKLKEPKQVYRGKHVEIKKHIVWSYLDTFMHCMKLRVNLHLWLSLECWALNYFFSAFIVTKFIITSGLIEIDLYGPLDLQSV